MKWKKADANVVLVWSLEKGTNNQNEEDNLEKILSKTSRNINNEHDDNKLEVKVGNADRDATKEGN